MSIKSYYSLSGDNYLIDNAELSSEFSFEEFRKPNLSSKTVISTSSSCK